MQTIGLFPLNIVLFPGSSYPLHIFEARYKILIREAIDTNGEFGINLVDEGKMFQTGCKARVSNVLTVHDDGKMDIVVTGTDRYVVRTYHTNEHEYITADVDPLEDEEPNPEFEMLERTIGLYNRLVESVYGEAEELLNPSDWVTGGASFRIAQKSGLELVVRQQLLEMRSENERLAFLCTYLEEILPKIRQVEKIQMLVRNDGYVKPDVSWNDTDDEGQS
ncbi:MAG: LON peptidase substrate-binding domain-containing protein [Bacteroidetes bacterium]|nr:LON peptidase substrate-binding domain-containing protein [Bacteroidota bacterium]